MFAFARHTNSIQLGSEVARAETQQPPNPSPDSKEKIDWANPKMVLSYYAAVYGVNERLLYKTVECESTFRHEGLFGDGGKAYGIAQFHKPTFKQYCQGDYKDMADQLKCMAEMFSIGQARHWTCYTKVKQQKTP